jgi:ribosomal-protein-serine acetyltransferase
VVARLPERIEAPGGLVLRRWLVEDAALQHAAIQESLEHLRPWMPWVEQEPLTLEGRRDTIAAWDHEWAAGGDVYLGIFEGGRVAGSTGLHRRLGPGALEIGYWLHPAFTGRGIATTAVGALTGVALALDGIERVEIHHEPANAASGAVPRRLGFESMGAQPDGDLAWCMTREEWAARRTDT